VPLIIHTIQMAGWTHGGWRFRMRLIGARGEGVGARRVHVCGRHERRAPFKVQ
jgi:hypothetical protein